MKSILCLAFLAITCCTTGQRVIPHPKDSTIDFLSAPLDTVLYCLSQHYHFKVHNHVQQKPGYYLTYLCHLEVPVERAIQMLNTFYTSTGTKLVYIPSYNGAEPEVYILQEEGTPEPPETSQKTRKHR